MDASTIPRDMNILYSQLHFLEGVSFAIRGDWTEAIKAHQQAAKDAVQDEMSNVLAALHEYRTMQGVWLALAANVCNNRNPALEVLEQR